MRIIKHCIQADLGRAKMEVVDGEEVHVLHVPAEEGLPHAKVGHWRGDARDRGHVVLLQQVRLQERNYSTEIITADGARSHTYLIRIPHWWY